MSEIGGDEGFGDVVQAGESELGAGAQCGQRAFHGGLAEDGFEAFADGGEDQKRSLHEGVLVVDGAARLWEAVEACGSIERSLPSRQLPERAGKSGGSE